MSYDPSQKLVAYTVGNINGKNTGQTTIYTTSSTLTPFFPLWIIVRATVATSVTIAPIFTVGSVGAGYTDLLGSTTLTGVTSANSMQNYALTTAVISSQVSSTAIKFNITTGATATTLTLQVSIIGFYTPF